MEHVMAPKNASKWQMVFNSAFKELTHLSFINKSTD